MKKTLVPNNIVIDTCVSGWDFLRICNSLSTYIRKSYEFVCLSNNIVKIKCCDMQILEPTPRYVKTPPDYTGKQHSVQCPQTLEFLKVR